jgi:hypothetical protein
MAIIDVGEKMKYREFVIADTDRYICMDCQSLICYEDPKELIGYEGNTLHVIEYSAYRDLEDRLTDKDEQIKRLQVELKLSEPLFSRRELESQLKEQCELNAISAERELKLQKQLSERQDHMLKVEAAYNSALELNDILRADIAKLKSVLDELHYVRGVE